MAGTDDAPRETHGRPEPASSYQVGGNHYQSMRLQPRYLIRSYDLGFSEGCIVKYVCRWRGKGGIEDLSKALQYVDMLIEDGEALAVSRSGKPGTKPSYPTATEFCVANELRPLESSVVSSICMWSQVACRDILAVVRDDLVLLIEEAKLDGVGAGESYL